MNVLNYLNSRLINGNRFNIKLSFDFQICDYYLTHEYRIEEEQDFHFSGESPPLAMASNNSVLATVTELGSLLLLTLDNIKLNSQWTVHDNAIFDIKWRPENENHLATASGDQSIALFDIEKGIKVVHLKDAHKSSIKSLSFMDPFIFATGARDGYIKFWDLRVNNALEIYDIPAAHSRDTKWTKKSPKTFRSCPTNCVTSVLFKGHYLFSGGANDGSIKIWDTKRVKSFRGQAYKEVPYFGTTSYSSAHGYTSLVFDSKDRLFANCSDNNIYCYSPLEDRMLYRLTGHKVNNYTKIAILNDNYLVSGSTDGSACIWSLNHVNGAGNNVIWPYYCLPHSSEVTAIETNSNSWVIYTCCDDERVRRWNFEPSTFCEQCESIEQATRYEKEEVEVIKVCNKMNQLTPRKRLRFKKLKRSPPLTPITNFITVTPRIKSKVTINDRENQQPQK